MRVINILFQFRSSSRSAHVHISSASDFYTVYFTDVELILEFGSKAKYNKMQGLKFLKPGKDSEVLKSIIMKQLEEVVEAA